MSSGQLSARHSGEPLVGLLEQKIVTVHGVLYFAEDRSPRSLIGHMKVVTGGS